MWKKIRIEFLFVIIFAWIFVVLESFSTSPIYKESWGGDSSQFMTIGMCWANGLTPYTEAFDHKGPFIFFVDMLGFKLTGDKTGVFIVQLCFMAFTALLLLKMAQNEEKHRFLDVLMVCLCILSLNQPYNEGNSVEEYCLPVLIASMYLSMESLLEFAF